MLHQDNYSHPISGITYIKESILGPGGDSDAFHTWFETTCTCSELSPCLKDCDCIKNHGENYHNSLLTSYKLQNELCVYECSAFCSCGEYCTNKVVQKGPNPFLDVRKAGEKGLGVFSLETLVAGTFIAEYAGELISKEVAEQRYREDKTNKYILILREHYAGNVLETCFDSSTHGNISRFINHSCSPNCVVIPVRTGCLTPKAAIFSNRIIEKNEEITYSYIEGRLTLSNSRCYCNSANCKGFLPSTVDTM